MSSPGQKRGSCGHVMALFDNHKKCARCRDKGVGYDPCVKKLDCQICKAFTPAQIHQLATPTYKERKERSEQKKTEGNASTTPTLVDPSEVTLLGRVSCDKSPSVVSTPKHKKKRSDGSPRSSKRKHSSKPTSDDLKSLDDKWSERFSRLEAMLVNQSFAVPVRPVNSASVVPREHPFFDPGASSSVMSSEGTGDVATQLTATQPPLGVPGTEAGRDGVESATHPVQGPGTSEVLATQPLLVPGAGTATQPSQALVRVLRFCLPVLKLRCITSRLPLARTLRLLGNLIVRLSWMGNRHHRLVFTARVIYRTRLQIRTSLKMPITGKPLEG